MNLVQNEIERLQSWLSSSFWNIVHDQKAKTNETDIKAKTEIENNSIADAYTCR